MSVNTMNLLGLSLLHHSYFLIYLSTLKDSKNHTKSGEMNIDMELNFTYVKGKKKKPQAIKIDNTFNDLMTGH